MMKKRRTEQALAQLDDLASIALAAAFLAEQAETEATLRQKLQPAIRALLQLIAERLEGIAQELDQARS